MVKKHRKSRKNTRRKNTRRKNTRRKNAGAKNNIRRKTKKRRSGNNRSKNMKRRHTRKSVVRSKNIRGKNNMKGGEGGVRFVTRVDYPGGQWPNSGTRRTPGFFGFQCFNAKNEEVAKVWVNKGMLHWEKPAITHSSGEEGAFSVRDLVGWAAPRMADRLQPAPDGRNAPTEDLLRKAQDVLVSLVKSARPPTAGASSSSSAPIPYTFNIFYKGEATPIRPDPADYEHLKWMFNYEDAEEEEMIAHEQRRAEQRRAEQRARDDDGGAEEGAALNASVEEAAGDTILVRCPEGVSAGGVLYVTTPDGREVSVEVPDGIGPGDEFEVYVGEEEEGEGAVATAVEEHDDDESAEEDMEEEAAAAAEEPDDGGGAALYAPPPVEGAAPAVESAAPPVDDAAGANIFRALAAFVGETLRQGYVIVNLRAAGESEPVPVEVYDVSLNSWDGEAATYLLNCGERGSHELGGDGVYIYASRTEYEEGEERWVRPLEEGERTRTTLMDLMNGYKHKWLELERLSIELVTQKHLKRARDVTDLVAVCPRVSKETNRCIRRAEDDRRECKTKKSQILREIALLCPIMEKPVETLEISGDALCMRDMVAKIHVKLEAWANIYGVQGHSTAGGGGSGVNGWVTQFAPGFSKSRAEAETAARAEQEAAEAEAAARAEQEAEAVEPAPDGVVRARAKHDHAPEYDSGLAFNAGDTVVVSDETLRGPDGMAAKWWLGHVEGIYPRKEGMFQGSYVELL